MKHHRVKPYKVCINHDPGMTLNYFMAGQLRLHMRKAVKTFLTVTDVTDWKKVQEMGKWTEY